MKPIIRNLRAEDKPALRNICYVTSSGFESPKAKEALYLMYCDYYVDRATETSFLAEGEDGKVLGYVFCAPSGDVYEREFDEFYAPKLKKVSFFRWILNRINAKLESGVAKKYPAHMHIDILPEAQRQGLGTALVDTLFDKLRASNVSGVYLCCGADNAKGIGFYRKYGFKEYSNRLGTVTFVYDLQS